VRQSVAQGVGVPFQLLQRASSERWSVPQGVGFPFGRWDHS
jgi:hypothetical protein